MLSEFLFNSPLGAIFIVVLLILTAFAAWGAIVFRPGRYVSEPPEEFAEYPVTTRTQRITGRLLGSKREEKSVKIGDPAPAEYQLKPPYPYKDKECFDEQPCAEERSKIQHLNAELGIATTQLGSKDVEIEDLTSRLANANGKLEELQQRQSEPAKPQKVTAGNVLTLLEELGNINYTAARQLRSEAAKPQPEYPKAEKRLNTFADYCEQRGFERPDPGQLLQLLQDALK